jgi:hypothetical protein
MRLPLGLGFALGSDCVVPLDPSRPIHPSAVPGRTAIGSRVPGPWSLLPQTRYPIPDTRYPIPDTRYLPPLDTHYAQS